MAGKRGNLRVRKGSALFGPMVRAELVKLVEGGRLAESDQVSADDGPWQPIGTYLARTAEAPAAEPPKSPDWKPSSTAVSRQPPSEPPTLRVLKENRVFPMMTRQQVSSLLAAGRLTGDELICALNGPWMCVADFFAPPAAPAQAPALKSPLPAAPAPPAQISAPAAADEDEEVIDVDEEDVIEDDEEEEVIAAEVVEEEEVLDVIEEDDEPAAVPVSDAAYKPRPAAKAATPLSNQWYVKVRGMHSAPLQKHHIKMLLAAREIDNDAPACHVTWRSEAWLPIKDIPELSDIIRRT